MQDQPIFAADYNLGTRPFPEHHPVADPEVDRMNHSLAVSYSRAGCQNVTLRGLFLGSIGNEDAPGVLSSTSTLFTSTRSRVGLNPAWPNPLEEC